MLSRRLLACLVALTLLFGQAAAFAHSLNHLNQDETALPDKVCEVCVAQASLGGGAPATVFSLPVEPARHIEVAAAPRPPAPVPAHHAQARAPPATI